MGVATLLSMMVLLPITRGPNQFQSLKIRPLQNLQNVRQLQLFKVRCMLASTPPPLVVPHPLSFPGGGGGVTWSTQNFSLRLIVLLCG